MRGTVKVIILALWLSNLYAAPEISIHFDFTPSETVLDMLESGNWDEQKARELIAHPAIIDQLKHNAQFDKRVTADQYLNSLNQAVAGTPLADDPVRFAAVIENQAAIRATINTIKQAPDSAAGEVIKLITPYIPEDLKFDATIFLMAGSNSCGWVIEGTSFYVDLRCIKEDYLGLIYLSAHELYHVAQGIFMRKTPTDNQSSERVRSLLFDMTQEGAASLVADFGELEGNGTYITFNRNEYKTNMRRIKPNFALFEALIQQAFTDPGVDSQQLYLIGLSGYYDSPLYYVGYYMLKALQTHTNNTALVKLMSGDIKIIFTEYMSLYHQQNKLDLIRFNKTTEAILDKL